MEENATAGFVQKALEMGFMGLDTACQPKHYNEPGVGEGLRRFLIRGKSRENLFVQTKFTPVTGQDPKNIPYDSNASLEEQVKQSLGVSQNNLGPEPIDSLVLHSPLPDWDELKQVWEALESTVDKGEDEKKEVSEIKYDDEKSLEQRYGFKLIIKEIRK